MLARNIVKELDEAGITLSLAGDRLKIVPRERLNQQLRALITSHRGALVEELVTRGASLPSLDDLDERAAIIAEGCGVSQAEGARRALAELAPGFPPPMAILAIWRREIERWSPADALDVQLQAVALELLNNGQAGHAFECGWDAVALFGVNPKCPRVDHAAKGLATAWAWSRLGITDVEGIGEDCAVLVTATGSRLRQYRTKPAERGAVPFWEDY
jgi:hypothetical protein